MTHEMNPMQRMHGGVLMSSVNRRTLANAYSSGKRIRFALPGRFLPFQEIKESSDLLQIWQSSALFH